eukprot:2999758-Pleurochrysis_carterae.AAC.2
MGAILLIMAEPMSQKIGTVASSAANHGIPMLRRMRGIASVNASSARAVLCDQQNKPTKEHAGAAAMAMLSLHTASG